MYQGRRDPKQQEVNAQPRLSHSATMQWKEQPRKGCYGSVGRPFQVGRTAGPRALSRDCSETNRCGGEACVQGQSNVTDGEELSGGLQWVTPRDFGVGVLALNTATQKSLYDVTGVGSSGRPWGGWCLRHDLPRGVCFLPIRSCLSPPHPSFLLPLP